MQNMHTSPRYITVWPSQLAELFVGLLLVGKSDAAAQWTKSFGKHQESTPNTIAVASPVAAIENSFTPYMQYLHDSAEMALLLNRCQQSYGGLLHICIRPVLYILTQPSLLLNLSSGNADTVAEAQLSGWKLSKWEPASTSVQPIHSEKFHSNGAYVPPQHISQLAHMWLVHNSRSSSLIHLSLLLIETGERLQPFPFFL